MFIQTRPRKQTTACFSLCVGVRDCGRNATISLEYSLVCKVAIGRISCRIELADSGFNFHHANLVLPPALITNLVQKLIFFVCSTYLIKRVGLTTHHGVVQRLCLHCAPLAQYQFNSCSNLSYQSYDNLSCSVPVEFRLSLW